MSVKKCSVLAGLAAFSVVFAACFSQSAIGSQVTVENIRRVKIGMSRTEVEHLLGPPLAVESNDANFHGVGSDTMVYSRRLPVPMGYPMLWVTLRNGRVEDVYAKRHHIFDSFGVYGIRGSRRWETADFVKTFPSSGAHESTAPK